MADDASWTIKAVPIETRRKALKAANFKGLTVGRWLIQAVDRQADLEAANEVIPPGKPERPEPPTLPDIDLAGMAAAISATLAAYQAAGDEPPKALALNASATLNRYLRAARWLSPSKGRPVAKIGQTRPLNGQTIEGAAEPVLMDSVDRA